MRTPQQARRGLAIYFIVLIAASAALEVTIIRRGGLTVAGVGPLIFALMYVPTLASIVARVLGREGIRDISFAWGGGTGTRAVITAWLVPVFVAVPAYGIAWSTGLVGFAAPATGTFSSIANPVVRLIALIPLALTMGTALSALSAFGEEVGWRGYIVPRLVEGQIPHAYLVSALVWCGWHVPLTLWGGYATGSMPALSALLFVAAILPVGLIYAKWRMASGSVWPCVIAHASRNVVVQSVFDPFASSRCGGEQDRRHRRRSQYG